MPSDKHYVDVKAGGGVQGQREQQLTGGQEVEIQEPETEEPVARAKQRDLHSEVLSKKVNFLFENLI